MAARFNLGQASILCLIAASALNAGAQAPDVPIHKQGRREAQLQAEMGGAAKEIFYSSNVLKFRGVSEQLKRTACQLELPKPNTIRMSARALWTAARDSHMRVGW